MENSDNIQQINNFIKEKQEENKNQQNNKNKKNKRNNKNKNDKSNQNEIDKKDKSNNNKDWKLIDYTKDLKSEKFNFYYKVIKFKFI